MWWEPLLVAGLLALAGGWLIRRLRATFRGDKACGGCGCGKSACSKASPEAVTPDAP